MVAPLNRTITQFLAAGLPIIASRDWHPATTRHFQPHGGPWPVHCVQHSAGAAFHPNLRLPASSILLSKGMDAGSDGYSAFEGTDDSGTTLAHILKNLHVTRLCVGGLATDYCVRATVLDGLRQGFAVVVLRDAVAAVNIQPEDGSKALAEMEQAGAEIMQVSELLL